MTEFYAEASTTADDLQTRIERLRVQSAALMERAAAAAPTTREAARQHVSTMRAELDQALKELDGLRTAMQTRGVIEQAKGMIMAALKIDEDAAFDVLVHQSQTAHRKVIEVARDVVATGASRSDPAPRTTTQRAGSAPSAKSAHGAAARP